MAHTPGPWNYAKSDFGDERFSIYANGPLAYSASAADYGDAALANARLIAASPNLLAACQAVVTAWESGDLAAAARQCQAAISAATGKE
jgi:hypothetical protein